MMYFPVFTQIEGKRCLVVGGGKVAARKVHTLLQYRADVVVIAKKVCDEIKEVLPEKSIFEDFIKNEESDFLEKEIQKAFLVVAATSSREENHRAAELCHAYHILVNVADSEAESSFIFPSVVRKGNIVLELTAGQEARLYPNRFVARLKKLFRIIMQILQFLWENFASM